MKFEKDYTLVGSSAGRPIRDTIETCVLTAIVILLLWYFDAGNPFTLVGPYPWLCVVPVFCALFYGPGYGILSLIILMIYLWSQQADSFGSLAYREYSAGMATISFLAAMFSNYWNSRIESIEQINQYVRKHLEDLSRDYYLLKISHDRIDHAYLIKPLSLRDAFSQIKKYLEENPYSINQEGAKTFLEIFCQYCSADSAILCLYSEKEMLPTAHIGSPFEVNLQDLLVKQVIDNKKSTIVGVNSLSADQISEYKLVVPILSDDNELIGMVVIKEIPFWSLNDDTIEVLALFAAVLGMYWSNTNNVGDLIREFPAIDSLFLNELNRLVSLKKRNNIDSFITGLIVPEGPLQQQIVYGLQQSNRSLDYSTAIPVQGGMLILTLMPLSNLHSINGYKHRITEQLLQEFGKNINQDGLLLRSYPLESESTSSQLHAFLREFDYGSK